MDIMIEESACNTDGCVEGCFPACTMPSQPSFAFGATGGIIAAWVGGYGELQ
jgi:hypothetical protein